MKKEEILAKSCEENPYGDEREQQIMLKSQNVGYWTLTIGTLILTCINLYFDLPIADLYILVAVGGVGMSAYRLIKCPTKSAVFFTIVFLIIFIKAVYEYYLFVM